MGQREAEDQGSGGTDAAVGRGPRDILQAESAESICGWKGLGQLREQRSGLGPTCWLKHRDGKTCSGPGEGRPEEQQFGKLS